MTEDYLAGLFARAGDAVEDATNDLDAREAHLCKSDYVGELDERQVLRLTLVNTLGPFPGDWGDRFGYIFNEADTCNVVIWWTTGKPPLEEGETGDFTCTITKQEEYQGKKQTMVSRIKAVNEKVEKAKKRRMQAQEEENEAPQ